MLRLKPPYSYESSRDRIRVLVTKPGLDGHDRGALVLCRALRDAGMEVIYSGLLPTPEEVAQIAIDEDVDVVAMSLLNNVHLTAFPAVARLLQRKGKHDVVLVGGGIIPAEDKIKLEKEGITGNFGPGTPLKVVVDHIRERIAQRARKGPTKRIRRKLGSAKITPRGN